MTKARTLADLLDSSGDVKSSALDNATSSLSDLSVTATASELNILDGITATTAELNYTDGVTSNIQTQINGITQATGNELENVSEDTSPSLGGDLSTNGNDVNFGDNDKAQFGTGNDLQIYHDGSDSYINDAGTGDLKLGGNQLQLNNAAQTKNYLYAVDGAQVELKYNNAKKLETTSSGAKLTGGGTNNLDIVSNGGAGYTQGDIRISSSTADGPSGRGQGVYLFNEGNDRTWYMGTLYNSGTSFGIGTTTGANVEPAAADRGKAQITINTNGKVYLGPEYNNQNTNGNKIFGMRAPNILSWEDDFSTTQGSTIPSQFTNWYNVRFDKLNAINRWYHATSPFGGEGVAWRGAASDATTGGQGGWGTNGISIDRNYDYVLINFVQRVSSAASGTYYFGTSGGVVRAGGSNNGVGDSNPYFTVIGTSHLVKDEWYVDYRTIRSANNTSTSVVKNNGLYRMRDGVRLAGSAVSNANAYRFSSTQTTCNHRTYLYYATANDGTALQWYQPMMFKCDGTQPTLSEIFKLYETAS